MNAKKLILSALLFLTPALAWSQSTPIGQDIRGNTLIFSSSPTLDTATHAANDVVATITITNAVRADGWSGTLDSIVVSDDDDQGSEIDFHCFDRALTTAQTNNAALAITDADLENYLGSVTGISTYEDTGANKTATKLNIGLPIKASSGSRSIVCVAVTQGTPLYTASGLTIKFGIYQD